MKRQPNKRLVGIFLVMGIIAFGFIIGQIAWNQYVSNKQNIFVAYFDETIQGLSKGSPVVLQGVEVGSVSAIKLAASEKDLKFRIPVYIRMNRMSVLSMDSSRDKMFESNNEFFKNLIKRGLKARLSMQSYLTGQLMIELVMLPDEETKIVKDGGKFPQIPTVLSKSGVLEKGLDSFKVQEIVSRISRVWSIFEQELPVLLPKLSSSAVNLNKVLSQISTKSSETISTFNKALQDVSDASRSLQNLTDYLERHPESLLNGKKKE